MADDYIEQPMNVAKETALHFLTMVHPDGPWCLTAINPERKQDIQTRTFTPGEEDLLEEWVADLDGKSNLYFQVNPPRGRPSKKPGKLDIARLTMLHVDLDPRPGEDIEAERARALGLLRDRRPPHIPEPTYIVFSGGGYQAFWALAEPLELDGSEPQAEAAKLWNKQLEIDLGGDACHNIDRLMRLPGTMNVPDAKKRAKGREPCRSELVQAKPNLRYSLGDFHQARPDKVHQDQFGDDRPALQISGERRVVNDMAELDEWHVEDRVKVIIAQGHDPDHPKPHDNSRSAWVFDAVCSLARRGVPDAVIYSLLTDPDWGISESILEQKNYDRYARRQITRAKEYVVHPKLAELNDRFAVIGNFGGKCVVVEELPDHSTGLTRLSWQTLNEFTNRHEADYVVVGQNPDGGPVEVPAGKWWRKHPQRRQYETVIFAPGKVVDENVYNLWRGFAYAPVAGRMHEPFLQHILDNVCQKDRAAYQYLLNWMARAVQQPDSQGHVAVVLRGGKGTGKSFLATHFGKLFGRHYMAVSNPSHVTGNFNAHLENLVVLFSDEAIQPSDKKGEAALKVLITEDRLPIERKFIDVQPAPNYIHLIMASNDDKVVNASSDERRYLVLEMGDARQKDHAYFGAIAKSLEDGGYENLLHFLLTMDLSNFNVRNVPETAALRRQQHESLPPAKKAVWQMLDDGIVPFLCTVQGGNALVSTKGIINDNKPMLSGRDNTAVGRELGALAVQGVNDKKRMVPNGRGGTEQAILKVLPPLTEARLRWEMANGLPGAWSDPNNTEWASAWANAQGGDGSGIPF